jgi:hypothetical protein
VSAAIQPAAGDWAEQGETGVSRFLKRSEADRGRSVEKTIQPQRRFGWAEATVLAGN